MAKRRSRGITRLGPRNLRMDRDAVVEALRSGLCETGLPLQNEGVVRRALAASDLLLGDAASAMLGMVRPAALERVNVVSEWGAVGSREPQRRLMLRAVELLQMAKAHDDPQFVASLLVVNLKDDGEAEAAKRVTNENAAELLRLYREATRANRPPKGEALRGERNSHEGWERLAVALAQTFRLLPVSGETLRDAVKQGRARKVGGRKAPC